MISLINQVIEIDVHVDFNAFNKPD